MVRLDRIYTRSGDNGQTSLGDGTRIDKTSLRIQAMGSVDEVNCHLGMAASLTDDVKRRQFIEQIQQLLFDLGADLCTPVPDDAAADQCPRIGNRHIQWLEQQIDANNESLDPLTSFILPGGCSEAATLHLARSVCRRSELEFLRLATGPEAAGLNKQVGIFLNRLSDLLFVLGRRANQDGANDILWSPDRTIPKEDNTNNQ